MPRITVQALRGRTLDQRRELARVITDATVRIYGVEASKVTIKFEEHDPQDISKAGVLGSDTPSPSLV